MVSNGRRLTMKLDLSIVEKMAATITMVTMIRLCRQRLKSSRESSLTMKMKAMVVARRR